MSYSKMENVCNRERNSKRKEEEEEAEFGPTLQVKAGVPRGLRSSVLIFAANQIVRSVLTLQGSGIVVSGLRSML